MDFRDFLFGSFALGFRVIVTRNNVICQQERDRKQAAEKNDSSFHVEQYVPHPTSLHANKQGETRRYERVWHPTLRKLQVRSTGLPPVIGDNARVLILGSLPGQRSLRDQQYYAHPQNSFWRLMAELTGVDPGCEYAERCNTLKKNRIALWDVLASSLRPGSLDSAIELASAKKNDFAGLLSENQGIQLICFNGKKSRELFDRLVVDNVMLPSACEFITLPSSSPAYAAMSFDEKLKRWSEIGQHLDQTNSK